MTRSASLRRSFPTFRLIVVPFRWIGKSRRRIWCTVLILLAMIAVPPLWWWTQLVGLPDIGDPFDVAAFRAMTIPDDRNAFVLYRQAAAVLKPLKLPEDVKGRRINHFARWADAEPEFHRWVEENREALALYRQGAEMPDCARYVDRVPYDRSLDDDREPPVLSIPGSARGVAPGRARRDGRGLGLVSNGPAHDPSCGNVQYIQQAVARHGVAQTASQ